MKWFKHMTDMLDDTFIIRLTDEYGIAGYGMWVGLLEIYAKYSKDKPGEWVEINQSLYEYKLRSKRKTIIRLLVTCQSAGKLEFKDKGFSLELKIPKMAELRDEWSSRKNKNSGVAQDKLPYKKEEIRELTKVNSEEETYPPNLLSSVSYDSKPTGKKIGHRIPDGWEPKPETLEWAKQKRPDLRISEVLEEFRDYWASAAGAYARKVDWDLTFKNRIRAYPSNSNPSKQQTGLSLGRPKIVPASERKGGVLEL